MSFQYHCPRRTAFRRLGLPRPCFQLLRPSSMGVSSCLGYDPRPIKVFFGPPLKFRDWLFVIFVCFGGLVRFISRARTAWNFTIQSTRSCMGRRCQRCCRYCRCSRRHRCIHARCRPTHREGISLSHLAARGCQKRAHGQVFRLHQLGLGCTGTYQEAQLGGALVGSPTGVRGA